MFYPIALWKRCLFTLRWSHLQFETLTRSDKFWYKLGISSDKTIGDKIMRNTILLKETCTYDGILTIKSLLLLNLCYLFNIHIYTIDMFITYDSTPLCDNNLSKIKPQWNAQQWWFNVLFDAIKFISCYQSYLCSIDNIVVS